MQNFINAPHRGDTPGVPSGSPNAALLIDFDNVTMGIRSDLTSQLKDLLNSDIIRGKVAVQRAYADWRRYAQYIVPLSEASVDLIFAPAYGSSKKNATDIRLAIDALELVFTRPEIGTYILLSGDSDFSSLVLKLKEYGKYVIGVGLRESASDLLVQNCDEYFSYSSLTGLTKAGEEDTVSAIDPWELVERSVNRMADDDDVMRSDRLKQVMLDLNPSFDESEIGYSKFNKFLTEAASRNRLALRKLGNGQYEVQPFADSGTSESKPERKRSREDRDESRSRGRKRQEPREIKAEKESRTQPQAPSRPAPRSQKPAPEPQPRERREKDLEHGYDLLRTAIRGLTDGHGDAARDSDIKRKMLELESGWDESSLGFTKFSRFLRQAHDAEVIDLQRTAEGYYEARVASGVGSSGPKRGHRQADGGETSQATRPAPTPRTERRPEKREEKREDRNDRASQATPAAEKKEPEARKAETPPRERKPERKPEPETRTPEPPRDRKAEEKPQDRAEKPAAKKAEEKPAAPKRDAKDESVKEAPVKEESAKEPSARAVSYGRRGGRRKGGAGSGPPPLLPGQAVGGSPAGSSPESKPTETKPAESSPAASQPATSQPSTSRAEESRAEESKADESRAVESKPAAPKPSESESKSKPAESKPAEPESRAARQEAPAPAFDPDDLGLPTDAGAVIRYLSNSYQGVGQKTAEALIEAFGAERVFNGLNSQPEKVKEVLGSGRRTEILLDAWQRDYRRRSASDGGEQNGA